MLTEAAPKLPPITKITGLLTVKLHKSRAEILSPFVNSSLIGEPVRTAFSFGSMDKVSGKLQQIFFATGIHSLFASPGVISDSWIIQGMCRDAAARTTGTLTNPPLEKTTSGFIFFKYFRACANPFMTRKGSVKFLRSRYLLNLPVAIS